MKFFIKKGYFILFILFICTSEGNVFAKNNENKYSRKNIFNYFSGLVSVSQGHNKEAFKYFKKVQSIKNSHSEYNIEFVRTLVLLEKFEEAFNFSESVWKEEETFFEADLLLGLNSLIKKDYISAENYFERLNKVSRQNIFFDRFIGNILISWTKASQGKKDESFKIFNKIPDQYYHLKNTQNIFLQCYFDSNKTENAFKELIDTKDYNFSRYNFFLINYLIHEKKLDKAKKVIENSRKKHDSNLLLKQTEYYFLNEENEKIKSFFNCKKPEDAMAEFFYIISNLYATEGDYQLSNFYLKLSLFLNKNFQPNKALLAENFFYEKKNEKSKDVYKSLKKVGPLYSWHASKSIATILLSEKGKKDSINYLEKEFASLKKINFDHFYDLANFYKDIEYFEDSIKFYSLALNEVKNNKLLIPKILEKRGVSYERLGEWKKAEKDLKESLKILPDQPYVLNYLAYTWIDMGINLEEGLKMLKKAFELRSNDGYIIDSLGWAYYLKKNYTEAELFLEKAVELLPSDPIIHDHYADTLWMLNKNIQARYFWEQILKFDRTEEELKKKLKKKLIFGINQKL